MAEEIVLEVFWTDTAKATFNNIVEYLQKEWSYKEVQKFIERTEEMLSMLQRYPEMCRPSVKRKNVRIGILDKHTQMVYHYRPRKKQIDILLFWGMKKDPVKFRY